MVLFIWLISTNLMKKTLFVEYAVLIFYAIIKIIDIWMTIIQRSVFYTDMFDPGQNKIE